MINDTLPGKRKEDLGEFSGKLDVYFRAKPSRIHATHVRALMQLSEAHRKKLLRVPGGATTAAASGRRSANKSFWADRRGPRGRDGSLDRSRAGIAALPVTA